MPRSLTLVLALLLLAAGPAGAARAAQVRVIADGTRYGPDDSTRPAYALQVTDPDGTSDAVRLEQAVEGGPVTVTGATPGDGCTASGAAAVCGPVQRFTADLGAGDDAIAVVGPRLGGTIHAGPGDDTLTQATVYTTWDGGPGADTVAPRSSAANAVVTYEDRTAPVRASFDGLANDGEAGEGDDIGSAGVEVIGGSGDDVLAAGQGRGYLVGGLGDDTLIGGPGDDSLDGGGGADVEDGGPGNDDFTSSGEDIIRGGPGVDGYNAAAYPNRLTYLQDGLANDGLPGQRDNLTGIERMLITARQVDIRGGAEDNHFFVDADTGTVDGAAGDDRIIVQPTQQTGHLRVRGGPGDDVLIDRSQNALDVGYAFDAGPGRDTLIVHDRRDTLNLEDGERDTATCQNGLLTPPVTDRIDRLRGCGTPIVITTPTTSLRIPAAGRPAPVTLRCPSREPSCTGTVRLRIDGKTIAAAPVRLAAGTTRTVAVPVTPAARRKLLVVRNSGAEALQVLTTRPQPQDARPAYDRRLVGVIRASG